MTASTIIFYLLGSFTLVLALMAVTSRRIFRSAIWLLLSLVGIAGVYFWLKVEFLAAIQIVVYVGGIVVLIIFSIFLTQQSGEVLTSPKIKRTLPAVIICLGAFLLTSYLIIKQDFRAAPVEFQWNMQSVGRNLLDTGTTGYALPLELVSILLLAAMIGCIIIAMKRPGTRDDLSSPKQDK